MRDFSMSSQARSFAGRSVWRAGTRAIRSTAKSNMRRRIASIYLLETLWPPEGALRSPMKVADI